MGLVGGCKSATDTNLPPGRSDGSSVVAPAAAATLRPEAATSEGPGSERYFPGAVLIVTAFISWCPLYAMLGLSTKPKEMV